MANFLAGAQCCTKAGTGGDAAATMFGTCTAARLSLGRLIRGAGREVTVRPPPAGTGPQGRCIPDGSVRFRPVNAAESSGTPRRGGCDSRQWSGGQDGHARNTGESPRTTPEEVRRTRAGQGRGIERGCRADRDRKARGRCGLGGVRVRGRARSQGRLGAQEAGQRRRAGTRSRAVVQPPQPQFSRPRELSFGGSSSTQETESPRGSSRRATPTPVSSTGAMARAIIHQPIVS